eukprot:TRINITY_DN11288_c0_g2_i1.p1 TRINITY_DN11288_c0_g2~~TRINITY_DN11288_c0_g2_i1.p1  ORF type:complete len:570 (-),score=72.27 TRINITY_DN11288_c0_g2_i1:352-2061(-)
MGQDCSARKLDLQAKPFFSSASVSISASQGTVPSLFNKLFPSTSTDARVPQVSNKVAPLIEPAFSEQNEVGNSSRGALKTDILPARVFVGSTRPLRRRKQDGKSLGVCMNAGGAGTGAATNRSLASFINDIIRRHTSVVPLGCSSLSAHSPSPSQPQETVPAEDAQAKLVSTKRQRRVLILMSDTGGGHRASAEAIKSVFESRYGGDYKVTVIDLWKEHTPWPFSEVPRSYSFLVKHEALWRLTFHATAPRFVHQPQMAATSAFVAREVAKGLVKYQPDVIVSVHPLMQHIPLRVLRSKGMLGRIPFCTVITDLDTCHPTWFHKLVTTCFCPTPKVAQRALKAGLQSSQLRVHGLPIRPDFIKPTRPKAELRQDLGMDVSLPAVLLIGGGEGMGPVEATARALAKQLGTDLKTGQALGQLVVVCGRNKKLAASLSSTDWPMPTLVQGFVTNMSEWMAACDCIITKAGPGTIAEALIKGLPMVLNDYIAGQETGNVPFVTENGAGKYSEKPAEIAEIVRSWFGEKAAELKVMAQNCLRLARPDAVFKIVEDLDALARQRDSLDNRQLAFT